MSFEENLRKTASICFLLKDTIANSSGEFGLDETLTECKVSFIKQNNFMQSNAAISFIYKLKNVSLTFQLTFLLNFCAF